jgi:hypothetical protein
MAAGDAKFAYGSSSELTCTLASLATSATFVAGRESTAVDNTSNKYLDYLLGGRITVGTTPTVNTQIQVWVYANVDDTPTYPDVFDGTDSAETVTSEGIRDGCLKLAATMFVDTTTSDRVYWFGPVSVAALFGGDIPKFFGVFVVHNTGVNFNATGGNHVLSITPVFINVAQS